MYTDAVYCYGALWDKLDFFIRLSRGQGIEPGKNFLPLQPMCDGKSLVLPKTCAPSCLEKMLYGEIYSDSERRASNLLAFSSQPIRNQPGGALAGF